MKAILILLLILAVALPLVVKLISREVPPPRARFEAYRQTLERLDARYPEPPPPAVREAGLARFGAMWSDLTEASVSELGEQVYAEEAWFNDTVKTLAGGESIAAYLLETARRVDACTVSIDHAVHDGADTYIRWTMRFVLKGRTAEDEIMSCGMSHLRFNPEGQVVLHQDFWDPAGGMYEYFPGLGWLIRQVRGRI